MMHDLQTLTIEDFRPLLNQKIGIRFTDHVRLDAELIELKPFQLYTPLEREPFSMVLRTEQQNEYYSQSIFIVEHPTKGDLPIFLVPIGLAAQGMRYEAIFA